LILFKRQQRREGELGTYCALTGIATLWANSKLSKAVSLGHGTSFAAASSSGLKMMTDEGISEEANRKLES